MPRTFTRDARSFHGWFLSCRKAPITRFFRFSILSHILYGRQPTIEIRFADIGIE